MLEYSKKILEKVSFDRFLFLKELRKAKKNLEKSEGEELDRWCALHFGGYLNSFSEVNDRLVCG